VAIPQQPFTQRPLLLRTLFLECYELSIYNERRKTQGDFSFFLSVQRMKRDFTVVWRAAGAGHRLYFQSQRKP